MGRITSQRQMHFVIILLCLPQLEADYYYAWYSSRMLPGRLMNLMRTYLEEGSKKVEAINPIRFVYEETPQYELGYIMGELIERYRKMVELNKRPITFISDGVFDTLKRTEMIQRLYFEIYHLVNMMHEIPRKYGLTDDMATSNKTIIYDRQDVIDAQNRIAENERRRAKAKKKRLREMKKLRDLFLKGQMDKMPQKERRPKNKWWPIDYGWEIDYYW